MTLTKRDVEAMLAAYDADPVGALEAALRRLLRRPAVTYDDLLHTLLDHGRVTDDRWLALTDRQLGAMDLLAAELNETRNVTP